MQTTQDFLNEINKSLGNIIGLKVKKSDTYHDKKRDLMMPFITNGLRYSIWGINDELHNEIFSICFEIKKDGRVKNNMAGEILKSELKPVNPSIDLTLPLDKYLLSVKKLKLENDIEVQKQTIENSKKNVIDQGEYLESLNDKLLAINSQLINP